MRGVALRPEPVGPLMVTVPASRLVTEPDADRLPAVPDTCMTVQDPEVMEEKDRAPSWKPEICVNPPPTSLKVKLPKLATFSVNETILKPPVVIVPPLSSEDNCVEVYPGCTHALAEAFGAMESVVAGLSVPFTEIWKLTAHPVGVLAGN